MTTEATEKRKRRGHSGAIVQMQSDGEWHCVPESDFPPDVQSAKKWIRENGKPGEEYRILAIVWTGKVSEKVRKTNVLE